MNPPVHFILQLPRPSVQAMPALPFLNCLKAGVPVSFRNVDTSMNIPRIRGVIPGNCNWVRVTELTKSAGIGASPTLRSRLMVGQGPPYRFGFIALALGGGSCPGVISAESTDRSG